MFDLKSDMKSGPYYLQRAPVNLDLSKSIWNVYIAKQGALYEQQEFTRLPNTGESIGGL